jgi:hypothetical protein
MPITSEVAAIWIEGSEHQGQFQNSVVLQGKDRSTHGNRSYHGRYDPLSDPLFFPRGELGWHNMIPKVGVNMDEVNAARAIRKAHAEGNNDDDLGNFFFLISIVSILGCDIDVTNIKFWDM